MSARRDAGRQARSHLMTIRILAALPLVLIAAPVLAGPDCEGMAKSMPMWQVAKGFEEAGGTIRDMKVEDGCYEIKGDQAGKRVEVYFNPSTGAELDREEG
jgi:hypothetical protein